MKRNLALANIKRMLDRIAQQYIGFLVPITDTILPTVSRRLVAFYMRRYWGNKHPIKGFRETIFPSIANKEEFVAQGRHLAEAGVLILPSYFHGNFLDELRREVEGHLSAGRSGDAIMPGSQALSRTAVDFYLTSLISNYFGRPAVLATSGGMRYEPKVPDENDTTCWWHHDAKGNQIKVYILLTDLPEEGQRVDYIPGTHSMAHGPWNRGYVRDNFYSDNTAGEEVVRLYGKPIPFFGPAGTVIVFDTNGLHKGVRNLGPRRDVWQHTYTSGNHLFPLSSLHPEVEKILTTEQRRVVRLL